MSQDPSTPSGSPGRPSGQAGPRIGRRPLLLGGLAGGLGAAVPGIIGGAGRGSAAYALDRALKLTASRAVSVAGTTLEQTASPAGASGYRRLTAGPGYALVVRDELASGKSGRDDRRTALASVVQFTDLHMVDAQSPVRFEFLHEITGSAFRPHEALGTQGAVSLVRRINQLTRGPFSGRRFDCVVATGDNTDNHEGIELDWFLTVMSGGEITPNTGDPDRWEGVQSAGDTLYWNPEAPVDDIYKQAGFPTIAGYFDRATTTHTSPGLDVPWYSVFGNHDDSIEGTLPSSWELVDAYTGSFKFTGFADPSSDTALKAALRSGSTTILSASEDWKLDWKVTPDERRRPFTPEEYIHRHLYAEYVGPGPVGHGFDEEAASTGRSYYTFEISPGVVGVALDSTNRAGFTDGSIGDEQWRWLKKVLADGNSTYWDEFGIKHTHDVSDTYFVLFSHHTSDTMLNLLLDPAKPLDARHSGAQLVTLLQNYPSVLAWVNGHTHDNKLTPHSHDDPRRSFWEINTASHIDFPQQARIIDVCDNRDGTLSLFTTLVESASPYQDSYASGSQAALAALYRELSFNDLHYDSTREGTAADHNTELLLSDPLF